MRVYVAGPYTKGDVVLNVRAALLAGERLLNAGHVPFVPHLTHFWHLLYPHAYTDWLRYDNSWLPLCDAVIRLTGESSGADTEVALAKVFTIPVFNSVDEFFGWVISNENRRSLCN